MSELETNKQSILVDSPGVRGVKKLIGGGAWRVDKLFTPAFWHYAKIEKDWVNHFAYQSARVVGTIAFVRVLSANHEMGVTNLSLNPESVLLAATVAFLFAGLVDYGGLALQGFGVKEQSK